MLCTNCSKLASVFNKHICLRCKNNVLFNISVICDVCSVKDKSCSACLKKVEPPVALGAQTVPTSKTGGCGCGKKK